MTTDQRIENLEKGLASARRLNRWLLAAVGLALGVSILAGSIRPTTAGAPGGTAAASEPQGLPRYQIAVNDDLVGPLVIDTHTGDIYLVPSAADAQAWKQGTSKLQQKAWYKWLDGPPR